MEEDSPQPLDKCPYCGSTEIGLDAPGIWRFFFSLVIFPVSLLFLIGNLNRYCTKCGIRFRTIMKQH